MKYPRKRIRSKRSSLIKTCDALMFEILKISRGGRCEVCGKTAELGTFHILSKAVYPRLRYCEDNLLLTCWFPCHNLYHSDPLRSKPILKKIEELRGKDFEERLRSLNATARPLKTFYLEEILFGLTQTLNVLRNGDRK